MFRRGFRGYRVQSLELKVHGFGFRFRGFRVLGEKRRHLCINGRGRQTTPRVIEPSARLAIRGRDRQRRQRRHVHLGWDRRVLRARPGILGRYGGAERRGPQTSFACAGECRIPFGGPLVSSHVREAPRKKSQNFALVPLRSRRVRAVALVGVSSLKARIPFLPPSHTLRALIFARASSRGVGGQNVGLAPWRYPRGAEAAVFRVAGQKLSSPEICTEWGRRGSATRA